MADSFISVRILAILCGSHCRHSARGTHHVDKMCSIKLLVNILPGIVWPNHGRLIATNAKKKRKKNSNGEIRQQYIWKRRELTTLVEPHQVSRIFQNTMEIEMKATRIIVAKLVSNLEGLEHLNMPNSLQALKSFTLNTN